MSSDPKQDNQARLEFLEAALPVLIQQRNEALDAAVRATGEASILMNRMKERLAALEARVKSEQEAKVTPVE